MPDRDEKIFPALPQKRRRARELGEIARSRELAAAFSLAAFAISVAAAGPFLGAQILRAFATAMAATASTDSGVALREALRWPVLFVLGICALLSVAAVAGSLVQGGFVFATSRLLPQLARLGPLRFFGRIFSIAGAIELTKAGLKIAAVIAITWKVAEAAFAAGQSAHGVAAGLTILAGALSRLLYCCTVLAAVIAIGDYAYKAYEQESELRMTRQEFLDELKQEEGNPQVKRAVRRAQRKRFKRVPGIHQAATATVVLTNPTHLAVALRYRRGFDQAPLVVAKGAGEGAHRIIAIARLAAVPVLENRTLARTLFRGVEVGQQIPPRLYRAVAELLAMIMRIQQQRRLAENGAV
jgi:flagellar biosynthesis protein FlhB